MKTTTIKIFSALVLFLGLNKTLSAQCSINASFTYTTTDSSISITSTSTVPDSFIGYNFVLSGVGGYSNYYSNDSSFVFSPLYNGTYTVTLYVSDSLGACWDSSSQVISVSGGQNPPPCIASFTYAIGSAGQVICTNTSPVDPSGHTGYGWSTGFYNNPTDTFTFSYNGTYTITLNANNPIDGCSTSSSQTVSITNASPLPACNANFTYTVGAGGQVSFTSLYTGTAPNIYYGWAYGDGSNGNDTSSVSHTYLYNGTYTVTAYVTDSAAYCSTSTTETISVSTGINPPPCVASFSYAMGSAGFVTFTNTSPVDTAHNTSYYWSLGAYNTPTDTFTYSYNGTYTVSLSASNPLDNCSTTTTQTITITNAAPSPCASLSANYTYTLGANGQVSFTGTSTGTDINSTYIWNFGNGTGNSYYNYNVDTVYTYTSNGVYNVSLTITKTYIISPDSLYYYGTCYDSISIPITINNACNANFTYTLGASGQVNFTNAAGGLSYSWAFGDPLGSSSTLANPTFNYIYNGTYNVIFQIVDSSGYNCTTNQAITITNGLPPPVCNSSFSYTVGANAQVSFTSLGSGLSYYWSFGNPIGSSDTIPNPTFNYVYNGTYYVTLQLQDSAGGYCDSTQVITITNGLSLPVCDSIFTYTLGADGEVSFTNTSGGLSYYWSFGDPILSTSTLPNPTFTYVSNGTYTVTFQIQDSAGYYCNSSQVITVVNADSCTPAVNYSLYQDTIPHTWDVYPLYSSQVSSAVWHWGDGTSTAGLYPSHIYSFPNWYNICVTVFSACGDSAVYCQDDTLYRLGHNSTLSTMVYVNVKSSTTGVTQISDMSSTVSIYPNPNNGSFVIETNTTTAKILQVYDVNGKLILSQTVTDKTNIDAGNLNEGVYNVSLISSEGVVNKRLVIVR